MINDSPVVIIYGSDGYGSYEEKGEEHPFKIDGYGVAGNPRGGVVSVQGVSGGTVVPVSDGGGSLTIDAISLPLPTGAATETTLSSINTKTPSLGQTTMSGSSPVVIASDQSTVPVSDGGGSLTIDGTVTANAGTGPWPVTDNGGSLTVDGSVTVTQATASSLNATIIGTKTNNSATPGTNNIGVLPAVANASAPSFSEGNQVALSTDLSGALRVTGSISATNPSIGIDNATKPTSDTLVGGSDGTNLQAVRVFDTDSGAGTQWVLGTTLRKSASGGSVELGTSSDPIRTDPTGTTAQPVTDNSGSLTVDTPQLPSSLVGSRLDINNGAWLGSTAPTVGQKTMANSLPVAISSDQSILSTKEQKSSTSSLTNVAASISNVTLLAANSNRLNSIIFNDSSSVLYVKYGITASSTSFSYKLFPQSTLETDKWTGRIDGIWVSATGNARITELT